MNLIAAGAGLGAVKGMIEQPGGHLLDSQSGHVVSRPYTTVERLVNIGTNSAIGGGLGWAGQRLGLDDPRQVGRYIGQIGSYLDENLSGLRRYIPKVEIITSNSSPQTPSLLPEQLQKTIYNSTRWL